MIESATGSSEPSEFHCPYCGAVSARDLEDVVASTPDGESVPRGIGSYECPVCKRFSLSASDRVNFAESQSAVARVGWLKLGILAEILAGMLLTFYAFSLPFSLFFNFQFPVDGLTNATFIIMLICVIPALRKLEQRYVAKRRGDAYSWFFVFSGISLFYYFIFIAAYSIFRLQNAFNTIANVTFIIMLICLVPILRNVERQNATETSGGKHGCRAPFVEIVLFYYLIFIAGYSVFYLLRAPVPTGAVSAICFLFPLWALNLQVRFIGRHLQWWGEHQWRTPNDHMAVDGN